MKKKTKLMRLITNALTCALAFNTLSVLPAFAALDDAVSPYMYTIFAGSSNSKEEAKC